MAAVKIASLASVRNVLVLSLFAEGVTGLVVLLAPELVARPLFGADVGGAGVAFGRVLGVALLALVVACWPRADVVPRPALHAVFAYNLAAAVYLAYLGVVQHTVGILLWPAIAEHAIVALLLATRVRGEPSAASGRG